MLVFKYFKSRGQWRGTAKKGKRLRPAALSNVDTGTLFHKTPDGSKPEAKNVCPAPMAAVYLLHRCWGISSPSYRILCSVAKGSLDWQLDSKTHAPETQRQLFVLRKERDLREQGPPNPPVQFTPPLSFLCPCLPQAPPLRLHPASTVHSQGCCNEGMEERRWFMKPVLLVSPQPLAPLHELSTEAEEASDFKTGCLCSESKGLPDFFDHLFCIPYHTQSIMWINENKKPPLLHQISPCSFSLIGFTPCPWLFFSSKIPAHPQQRTGQTCPSSPFHLLGYLPGFKFLSCS